MISLLKYDLFGLFKELVDFTVQHKSSSCSTNGASLKFIEAESFWIYFVKHPSLIDSHSSLMVQVLGHCPLELLPSLSKFCIIPTETKYLQILIALCADHEYAIVSVMLQHSLIKFSLSFVNWLTTSLTREHLITKIILHNLPTYRYNSSHSIFNALLGKITNQNLLRMIYEEAQRNCCIELVIELKVKIDLRLQQVFFKSTDSIEDLIESSTDYDLFVDNLLVILACANSGELKRMAKYLKGKRESIYKGFVKKTGIELKCSEIKC